MDFASARARFTFLAEAFDGSGGFAPVVTWEDTALTDGSIRRLPVRATNCHLIPYARESASKYAGRCAVAVYENHLLESVGRFVSFLSRRKPIRTDANAPLVEQFLNDCDMRGSSLDTFFMSFASQAKARGSMLLLLDMMPAEPPVSLAQQMRDRRIPYLREIKPESVSAYQTSPQTGELLFLEIDSTANIGGQEIAVTRRWDAEGWYVLRGDEVLESGPHPFGACPVLAFTEDGRGFPSIGRYAQIADISRRLYNANSERDEILRGQTFSLLHLQIPAEELPTFDAAKVAATIGTHSMLTHSGDAPGFIAPDSGPAETYLKTIDALEQRIRRISKQESTADSTRSAESGVSRRLRFEALNAELADFSAQMASLETRMWGLFHRALGVEKRVKVEWPSDFNLVDSLAELDILQSMIDTGFPAAVLSEKRKAIAGAEFDATDTDTKTRLMAAIDEQAQEAVTPPEPGAQ